MAPHKFKIGEVVEPHPHRLDRNAPRGFYRIERHLPVESGNVQYRVKHIADGHERVMNESQLSKPQPQDGTIDLPDVPRTGRAGKSSASEAPAPFSPKSAGQRR